MTLPPTTNQPANVAATKIPHAKQRFSESPAKYLPWRNLIRGPYTETTHETCHRHPKVNKLPQRATHQDPPRMWGAIAQGSFHARHVRSPPALYVAIRKPQLPHLKSEISIPNSALTAYCHTVSLRRSHTPSPRISPLFFQENRPIPIVSNRVTRLPKKIKFSKRTHFPAPLQSARPPRPPARRTRIRLLAKPNRPATGTPFAPTGCRILLTIRKATRPHHAAFHRHRQPRLRQHPADGTRQRDHQRP